MIVISEYGYCECAPGREGGDPARSRILREHNEVFREFPEVGGLIFFDYNDYRTHIGDKGEGVMKQRVHGVVDLFAAAKPSYEELRKESSPVDRVKFEYSEGTLSATVHCRNTIPSHTMREYTVAAVVYGFGGLPMAQRTAALPALEPGQEATVALPVGDAKGIRVRVDVVRPTRYSVWTGEWKA